MTGLSPWTYLWKDPHVAALSSDVVPAVVGFATLGVQVRNRAGGNRAELHGFERG